jgi:UDP-N-acetylglucosamine 1-carboxyvinyltransferase (EC 2.5.1.7)
MRYLIYSYKVNKKMRRTTMAEFITIEGGHKLNGTVVISGAKNATVALIPAIVLADGPVTVYGVPDISDVEALGVLLRELNCDVTINEDSLIVNPSNLKNKPLVGEAVDKLRASYYLMGALLGKCKKVEMKMPGGCFLGPRPIDLHIKGFEALGATVEYQDGTHIIKADKLTGAKIYLDFASVGATINIMLAAVKAEGKTIIENAAKEPEIIDVVNLLTKMGAKIRGAGTDTITIEGVESLNGCNHEIIPDRIEAGTFLVIAAAAGEKVIVQNVIPQHLEAVISKLKEIGVQMEIVGDSVIVYGGIENLKPADIRTQVYPGFATDLQQPVTALLTQADGKSQVVETIYPERFMHCEQLNRMGANIEQDESMAYINGRTKLTGNRVYATDLRCGAALIVAALMAEGVTEIGNVYHIDRGYENIDHKLVSLGARITRRQIEE